MPARASLRLRDMREEPQVEVLGDGPAPGLVIRHVVWLLMYRFGAAVVSTVAGPARLVGSFSREPPCPSKVSFAQGPAFRGVVDASTARGPLYLSIEYRRFHEDGHGLAATAKSRRPSFLIQVPDRASMAISTRSERFRRWGRKTCRSRYLIWLKERYSQLHTQGG